MNRAAEPGGGRAEPDRSRFNSERQWLVQKSNPIFLRNRLWQPPGSGPALAQLRQAVNSAGLLCKGFRKGVADTGSAQGGSGVL